MEVLAHERSLMLAILAHLPFTSLVDDHISKKLKYGKPRLGVSSLT